MSEIEMGLWDDMLKATFVGADAVSTRPTQIIERIVERVADATNTCVPFRTWLIVNLFYAIGYEKH